MKILLLTYRVPYPPTSGERLRTFQILSLLQNAGHEVFLITFVSSPSDLDSIKALQRLGIAVTYVPLSLFRARLRGLLLACIYQHVPLQVLIYTSKRMKNAIREVVSSQGIDVVYAILARMGQYYSAAIPCAQVLDYMDAFSEYYRSRAAISSFLSPARFFDISEGRKMKLWESRLIHQYHHTTVVAEHDGRCISVNPAPSVISTHVDDFLDYAPCIDAAKVAPLIIFFGEMSTLYSESAALFAANQVMPIVWREFPSATLQIVGSSPTNAIASLASSRIVVTGFVEDLRPCISMADVSIVPLLMGSGLKNKIIQSMALRVPVVSTSLANYGIEASHEEHLLIADGHIQFAAAILRFLSSSDLRLSIAERAYSFVRNRYSGEAVSRQLSSALDAAFASYLSGF
jgi:glycosyltransferase involved in cell wall biosynthesis